MLNFYAIFLVTKMYAGSTVIEKNSFRYTLSVFSTRAKMCNLACFGSLFNRYNEYQHLYSMSLKNWYIIITTDLCFK